MSKIVSTQQLETSVSYGQYRELFEQLVKEKKTTGENQSESMVNYTKLNWHRFKRMEKTTKLNESLLAVLTAMPRKELWVVLTEIWCGDAAQNIPVLHKMEEASEGKIETRYLLRDEHPELMNQFLTNGARSIPVVIRLDADTHELLGHWGPRPAEAQAILHHYKADSSLDRKNFYVDLQNWYNQDGSEQMQKEFVEILG